MDSLSPRATHNCCQVWTATQQPIHYFSFHRIAVITALLFYVSSCSEVGSRINITHKCAPPPKSILQALFRHTTVTRHVRYVKIIFQF